MPGLRRAPLPLPRTPLQSRLRPLTLALCAALYGAPMLVATPAQAQSAARQQSFNVAPGPLARALRDFASQAGILLSADASLTDGKNSAGLQASASVEQGLSQLLTGTGLMARAQGDKAFVLMAQPTGSGGASGDSVLPTVSVTASGLPVPTQADDTYAPRPSSTSLHADTPMLEVPQVVNVVPAQVLRDQRPRNLDDALANVSGIVQGNTLASTQDTLLKRGFGGNRDGSIMHNGMPIVQGRGFNAATESVEVLKGPSSLLYGLMDPGGVVNAVSKKPLLEKFNSLSLGASSYMKDRNGGSITFDTTGPIGSSGLAYRLIVDHVDESYWRNFGKHRETLFAPSLAWYGEATQIQLSYEARRFITPFDRGTALDPRTLKPLSIPADERLDEPTNVMTGISHLGQLAITHQLNQNWKAHINLSYNRETYDAGQMRVTAVNTTTGRLTRSNDATKGSLTTDTYGLAYLDGTERWWGLRHDIQIGADAEYRLIYRKDLLRQATTSVFSYLNPVYGLEPPSSTVSPSDSDQTDRLHDQSFFMQDSLHLNDRWILVAGTRYQAYQQVAGRGRPFVMNTNTDDAKWFPRAGLVYKWSNIFSLYGSYTESLKPTSTIAPLAGGTVISASLAPEQSKSYEVGAKLEMPGQLTATAALFDIRKKNVLVSTTNTVTGNTDWRTSGAARSRGLELDVSGQLSARWSAIGSLSLLDPKTTEDPVYAGKVLINAARQTASLSAVYDAGTVLGDGRLRLGGGAHYVGKRPGDSANSFDLPAYTVADAFATYETRINGQKTRFQLNVKNLFNHVYYPSSVSALFVSMGDARQVSLLTTMEF